MKTATSSILFILLALFIHSCDKNNLSKNDENSVVSQFVYDGMSTYYLWADDMVNKKPTTSSVDPKVYFKSVLSDIDSKHRWSFITDDVDGLLASFSGEPRSFGFSLAYAYANEAKTEYIAILKYVFPETPASKAGLKRLDLVSKINGQPITNQNRLLLYGDKTVTLTINKLTEDGLVEDRNIEITPVKIQTNPVLLDTIYIDKVSGKKIGYIFYTDFIDNFNSSLFDAFQRFKLEKVTDLVLDLRYNHGGRITAATYLASLIAPENEVRRKAPFVTLSYNQFVNNYFDKKKWSRTDSLGGYGKTEKNPLLANLNLNQVYIIATEDSYSASELITYCLKPYMDVVHIGGNTGGKFTGSWTLHAYDENIGIRIYESSKLNSQQKETLRKWAMQPIVAIYTNYKGEDFSTPGYLAPHFEMEEGNGKLQNWTELGNVHDTYLGKALYEITGSSDYLPPTRTLRKSGMKSLNLEKIQLDNPFDVRKNGVILNNTKIKNQQEMIKELNERFEYSD